jgi:hypothetical protein
MRRRAAACRWDAVRVSETSRHLAVLRYTVSSQPKKTEEQRRRRHSASMLLSACIFVSIH